MYLTNDHDANGRVIKQTPADGRFNQFTYTVDGQGKVTQTDVTDPRGNVRRVTFNAAGYPLTDTRGFGTVLAQTTTYERQGNTNLPTSITDALGRRSEYTYDTMGNGLTITRLAGTANAVTTTFTYEPTFNQVATVSDPLSHTTTFGYDSTGNLTSITDPLSHQSTLTYNPAGQPLSITSPAGTTQLGYDQGDLVTVTDPAGQTTTRFSDGAAGLAQTTTYVRDATSNLVTSRTDALGRRTDYSYDTKGNVLTLTRLAGTAEAVTTTFTYEPSFNHVVTVTDPLSHTTTFSYDGVGNLTTITDPLSCGIGLLGGPVSDNGRLCQGAGGHAGGGRCRRGLMLTILRNAAILSSHSA